MKFKPYPFQDAGIKHALDFFATAKAGDKQLYAAPTGCGKSIMELCTQEQLPDCWIVSPRDEIVAGMLDKLGDPNGDMLDHNICTPIRMRNLLLKGEIRHPKQLIFDETHHHNAETWQQLDLLTGLCPSIGYTATPYRGSPRSTRELLDHWGEPLWIITFEEAAQEGYITVPTFEMMPLVDDDIIDVNGGEFSVESIESATLDRLGDAAEQSRRFYNGKWDMPTIYAMPSSACCTRLQQELLKRGLPCATVSANTPKADRYAAFEATKAGILALLHINIVSEGVDLPLRRLIDLAPTMSPVKWVQQLGRITRPTSDRPQYICTNRNILRHAYTLEGAVPVAAVVETEKLFGPTQRAHSRALGLEALGRFKPASTKMLNGAQLYVYSLSTIVNTVVIEYACLVPPTSEPIWATKVNTIKDGVKTYGSWLKCEPPQDVRGFASVSSREPSEKQLAWWNKSATRYGLDGSETPTRKSFQALPILVDLCVRLK